MDELHRQDISEIEEFITGNVRPKYEKGVREHGGHIWDKSVPLFIKESRDEITDLAVYLHHLGKKFTTIRKIVEGWEESGKISDEMWNEFSVVYDGTVHTDTVEGKKKK
jgi:hypothetical protein